MSIEEIVVRLDQFAVSRARTIQECWDIRAIIASWRERGESIRILSNQAQDHAALILEYQGAEEAMRAKCEAIARGSIMGVPRTREEIIRDITALKP